MCFFISIIVKGGDSQAIDMALRRHGRRAKPLDNPSMRHALRTDEAQFLTTVGHCDCGTALSPREHVGERQKSQTSKYIAKLKNKGWSAAKIDRWIADRAKAGERAEERHQSNAPDSLELWTQIIYDVMAVDDVKQAGLLLHFYSGDVENEVLQPTRKSVSICDFASQLRTIKEDQLLIATSGSG